MANCVQLLLVSERSEVSTRDSAEILWLQGICCEFEKIALAHYSHSGSLAGSNNVNSCYFSSRRLAVALVL